MEIKETTHNKRHWKDRRKFSYTSHIPERRAGTDRRASKRLADFDAKRQYRL